MSIMGRVLPSGDNCRNRGGLGHGRRQIGTRLRRRGRVLAREEGASSRSGAPPAVRQIASANYRLGAIRDWRTRVPAPGGVNIAFAYRPCAAAVVAGDRGGSDIDFNHLQRLGGAKWAGDEPLAGFDHGCSLCYLVFVLLAASCLGHATPVNMTMVIGGDGNNGPSSEAAHRPREGFEPGRSALCSPRKEKAQCRGRAALGQTTRMV